MKTLIDHLAKKDDSSIELEENDRDMDSGVPMKGKKHKEIDVGLMEFPEGEERTTGEGKGYELPFHAMDENFQATRTTDQNIRYLPFKNMTIDMVNRMLGKDEEDYDQGGMYGKPPLIDELVEEGGGKVKKESILRFAGAVDDYEVVALVDAAEDTLALWDHYGMGEDEAESGRIYAALRDAVKEMNRWFIRNEQAGVREHFQNRSKW